MSTGMSNFTMHRPGRSRCSHPSGDRARWALSTPGSAALGVGDLVGAPAVTLARWMRRGRGLPFPCP